MDPASSRMLASWNSFRGWKGSGSRFTSDTVMIDIPVSLQIKIDELTVQLQNTPITFNVVR